MRWFPRLYTNLHVHVVTPAMSMKSTDILVPELAHICFRVVIPISNNIYKDPITKDCVRSEENNLRGYSFSNATDKLSVGAKKVGLHNLEDSGPSKFNNT